MCIFMFYDRDEFPGSVRLSRCFLSVLSRELVHGEPNALAPAAKGCLGHSYLGCVGLHPLQKEDLHCIIDIITFYVFEQREQFPNIKSIMNIIA